MYSGLVINALFGTFISKYFSASPPSGTRRHNITHVSMQFQQAPQQNDSINQPRRSWNTPLFFSVLSVNVRHCNLHHIRSIVVIASFTEHVSFPLDRQCNRQRFLVNYVFCILTALVNARHFTQPRPPHTVLMG